MRVWGRTKRGERLKGDERKHLQTIETGRFLSFWIRRAVPLDFVFAVALSFSGREAFSSGVRRKVPGAVFVAHDSVLFRGGRHQSITFSRPIPGVLDCGGRKLVRCPARPQVHSFSAQYRDYPPLRPTFKRVRAAALPSLPFSVLVELCLHGRAFLP